MEGLARVEGLEARWRRLYDEDEAALEARLQDPLTLGDAYDPAVLLGAGGSWDDLADWGAGEGEVFVEACRRRVPARWVVVRAPGAEVPDLLGPLVALTGATVVEEDVAAALAAAVPDAADRLVVVVEGDAVRAVLEALLDAPQVRDRLVAVVAVGARIAPDAEAREWLARHFTAAALDTELNRITPYLSLTWVDRETDPPGVPGLPIETARFPPPAEERAPSAIEAVDLGLLPADPELPTELFARGLYVLVCLFVLARRQG